MIRILLTLTVLTLCYSATAKNSSNWKYKAFPVLQKNSKLKKSEPNSLSIGKNKLSAIMSRQSGTHRIWGVDQVYLNPKSSEQRLFVKYNVDLGIKAPIDGWERLNKGHIIHLKQKNKKYTAYFAQGFIGSQGRRELMDLQKQFKKNHVAFQPNYNWLVPCAHAEIGNSDPTIGYDSFLNEPQRTEPGRGPLARAERVMTCVGGQAIDSAAERGRALWESATWENVRNTAGAAWEAVPTLEETRSGVAAGATWVWDRVSDPSETWNRVTGSFDKTKQIFAQVYQEVATSMAGFRDLPPDVQDEIVCHIMAQMAADGALGVALGATGVGATVAVARLLNRVRTITTDLTSKLPRIRLIVEKNNSSTRVEEIRSILNEDPPSQRAPIAGSNPTPPIAPPGVTLLPEGRVPPGQLYNSTEHDLWLLRPNQLDLLPNGTVLVDVNGRRSVVGTDIIDGDTRGGFLGYGILDGDASSLPPAVRPPPVTSQRTVTPENIELVNNNYLYDLRDLGFQNRIEGQVEIYQNPRTGAIIRVPLIPAGSRLTPFSKDQVEGMRRAIRDGTEYDMTNGN